MNPDLPVNSPKRVSLKSNLESTPSFGWAFSWRGLEMDPHAFPTHRPPAPPSGPYICLLFRNLPGNPKQIACFHTLTATWKNRRPVFRHLQKTRGVGGHKSRPNRANRPACAAMSVVFPQSFASTPGTRPDVKPQSGASFAKQLIQSDL